MNTQIICIIMVLLIMTGIVGFIVFSHMHITRKIEQHNAEELEKMRAEREKQKEK